MAIPPPARGWWFPCQKIINEGTNTGTSGSNYTITPQIGTSALGNVQGGNLVISLQGATGSGTEASLILERNGTPTVAFTGGGSPAGVIYLGADAADIGGGSFSMFSGGVGTPLYLGFGASDIRMHANTVPDGDVVYSLGGPGARWSTAYTTALSGGTTASTISVNSKTLQQSTVLNDGYTSAFTIFSAESPRL